MFLYVAPNLNHLSAWWGFRKSFLSLSTLYFEEYSQSRYLDYFFLIFCYYLTLQRTLESKISLVFTGLYEAAKFMELEIQCIKGNIHLGHFFMMIEWVVISVGKSLLVFDFLLIENKWMNR